MEGLRWQGFSRHIRIDEALPYEIKGLLAEFAERDKRERELAEAKEKSRNEVR